MEQNPRTGIILLAAGNSSRLGEPKQLLQFKGKSLIRSVAEATLGLANTVVVVVTGANEAIIQNELQELDIHFAHNEEWASGMASSIRAGLGKLLFLKPALDQVIITVTDQPFVTYEIFQTLIEKGDCKKDKIVASMYDTVIGTPVLFSKKHFHSLLRLQGFDGAKKLLTKFAADIVTVPFPLGAIDIDTKEDYEQLIAQNSGS
jgi:molybdenum cofactor cytidylyltransferase